MAGKQKKKSKRKKQTTRNYRETEKQKSKMTSNNQVEEKCLKIDSKQMQNIIRGTPKYK